MRIKKIEFENFKIFKNKVRIDFDYFNNHFVILGTGGSGKTTFVEAVKWILFGEDSVRTSDAEKLFNVKLAEECTQGDKIEVHGEIIFDTSDINDEETTYWLKRNWIYRKTFTGVRLISKECYILKRNADMWIFLEEHPRNLIRKIYYGRLEKHMFLERECTSIDLRYLYKSNPLIVDNFASIRKREEFEKILKLYSSQLIFLSHYYPRTEFDKIFEIECDADRMSADIKIIN